MTYRVDATVKAVQASSLHPPSDSALVDPDESKFLCRHDSMLPSRNLSEPCIRRVAFLSHTESKATRP